MKKVSLRDLRSNKNHTEKTLISDVVRKLLLIAPTLAISIYVSFYLSLITINLSVYPFKQTLGGIFRICIVFTVILGIVLSILLNKISVKLQYIIIFTSLIVFAVWFLQ